MVTTRRPRKKIRRSAQDAIFDAALYILLALAVTMVLYPLIYIISSSFSSPRAVQAGSVSLLPVEPTLRGYSAIFENRQVLTGYWNSFLYTLAGTLVNIALTIMAAYPLSRPGVIKGGGFLMSIYVFTMLFSGGLIPNYLLVRSLGLYNTFWAMILPNAMSIWNLIITRTYFQSTIPQELYEVSEMEGANDLTVLFRIVLPLSGTIVAVNALFYAVGHWNSYFNALIYLKDADRFPLQIVLRNILILNEVDASMLDARELIEREGMKDLLKYSLIVVASIPALVIYPFLQKYFVKGVMVGSIKG